MTDRASDDTDPADTEGRGAQALGRVLDKDARDAFDGPRASFQIRVPVGWWGSRVRIAIPKRLPCAACDGGGCDACHRSGAHRFRPDQDIELETPSHRGTPVRLRLSHPLHDGTPALLAVEILAGEASKGVRQVGVGRADRLASPAPTSPVPLTVGLLVAAAVLVIAALLTTLR